jgi:hypothetical protein
MAHDASEMLGATQLAGVKVSQFGFAKKTAGKFGGAGAAGGVGGLISAGWANAMGMKAEKQAKQAAAESQTPQFGIVAWLAVTDREVALVELKREHSVGMHLESVIERVPRSEVASAEVGPGVLFAPPLTVGFTNGNSWRLEVPIVCKKDAKKLVRALGYG